MAMQLPTAVPSTPRTSAAAQRRLRNFLLDAPLQLKFAGSVVASTLVVAGLLGVFLYRTTDSLFRETAGAVEARSRAAEASRELGNATLSSEVVRHLEDKNYEKQLLDKSEEIDRAYEAERKAVVDARAELVHRQYLTLCALGGGLLAFVLFLGLLTIVITHRIVGPIYRVTNLARDIGGGSLRIPPDRLRPGDELKELVETFSTMVRSLRTRHEDIYLKVSAARTLAERSGVGEELIRELQTIEAKLKAPLE